MEGGYYRLAVSNHSLPEYIVCDGDKRDDRLLCGLQTQVACVDFIYLQEHTPHNVNSPHKYYRKSTVHHFK